MIKLKSNFSENFCAKNLNDWQILYLNYKNSIKSVKSFEIYLKSSTTTSITTNKITAFDEVTKCSSMWPICNDLLFELNELNTNINLIFKSRIKELIKDLKKYYNYLLEKKDKINKCEKETKKTIKLFKRLTKRLSDSKEKYLKLNEKLEKYQNLTTDTTNNENSINKLEQKLNKAKLIYETSIQNYNLIEIEYVKRFTQSCDLFQAAELDHLKTMLLFVNTYTQLCDQFNKEKEKIFQNYKFKLENNYTIEYLFDKLLENIRTSSKIDHQYNNNNNNNDFIDNNDNHLLISNKSQIKSRFSLLKNNNSTVSRSNLLIVAVVSEAFDKQIEQINEFESTKRNQNNSNNGIFENMDDFFESVKNKHTTRTHL